MKGSWEHPSVTIQDYEANEYVSSCWGVGCNINVADAYEQTHTNSAGVTWWTLGCNHTADHCQNADNQVIYDDNNDGIADRMLEEGTDGLGTLACTIYSDADYTTVIDVSSVKVGDLIYWTTTDNRTRIWHHVGTVQATVPGHPNRS